MSQSHQIQGQIHSIGETTEYGSNGFTKREFVILVTGEGENAQYPQHLPMEVTKEKCAMLDTFPIGTEVMMDVNINGRLWTNGEGVEKCFSSIQAWRISPIQAANPAQQPAAANSPVPAAQFEEPPAENLKSEYLAQGWVLSEMIAKGWTMAGLKAKGYLADVIAIEQDDIPF